MKNTVDRVNSKIFYDIARDFENNPQKINEDSFVLLEEGLRKHGSISEHADSFVASIIISVAGKDSCKSLILKNADTYKTIVEKATEHKEALYKALKNRRKESEIRCILGNYQPEETKKQ